MDNIGFGTSLPEDQSKAHLTDDLDVVDDLGFGGSMPGQQAAAATTSTAPVTPSPTLEWREVAKQAAQNLLPSAWENIKDTVSILDPIDTGQKAEDVWSIAGIAPFPNVQRLGQLAAELGIKTGGAITGQETDTPMLDAVIDFYKENYGFGPDGIEGFKRFLAEDPVGFITDILSVASLGAGAVAKGAKGAAVAARVSKIKYAARFEKYAKAASKVDEVVNKGFAIAPDADSSMIRGIYKVTEAPVVGRVARGVWNVTDDATTGTRRVGVGASELLDPGALALGGAVRVGQKVLPGKPPPLNTGLTQRAAAEGVDLIASARTQDPSIASREALAIEGGYEGFTQRVEEMNQSIEAFAERIADGIDDVEDASVAGERAIEGFQRYTRQFLDKKDELYENWTDEADKVEAVLDPIQEVIEQIKQESANPLGARPIPREIAELAEQIEAITNPASEAGTRLKQKLIDDGILDANGQVIPGKEADLARMKPSYLDLKTKRTEIREKMQARTDPIVDANLRWYAMVKHGLTKAMDDTIVQVAPHLEQAIKDADAFYAEGVTKLNSAWCKKIFKSAGTLRDRNFFNELESDIDLSKVPDANPEQLMKAVFQPSTSITQIPLIYEMVGGFDSDAGKAMRSYFVRSLFSEAKKTVSTATDRTDWQPLKLAGDIRKLKKSDKGRLEAFLGKEGADNVELLGEILASLHEFDRKATGSRTAPLLQAVGGGMGGLVGGIATSMLYGGNIDLLPLMVGTSLFVTTALGKKAWDSWNTSRAGQHYLRFGFHERSARNLIGAIKHMRHSATWNRIYMLANRPLREMMREAEEE